MGLKQVLSRMKLVEPDVSVSDGAPASASAAVPEPRRKPMSVQEILDSVPETPRIDEKILTPAPAGGGGGGGGGEGTGGVEIPDFETIYRSAGISDPAHGFSAYKVLEILSSPEFAPLESKAKAAALAGFLKMNPTGPVPLADVIQDAVRRDQALDKFEEILRANLARRAEQIETENARLQAEIDELTRRNRELMEANRRKSEAEQEQLALWLARKRIEERRLFDAVGPFVEENPISTERPPAG
jgi:hypothetical protein